ncbi:MAG: endonuclease MutS2 [Candidatus Izemoplasmatales bacterium]|nr:endonuclease MutS2 [Candidatus Izemoplasmatales bacterium]
MYTDISILEFDKILHTLKRYAVTDLAKQNILLIEPTNKVEDISLWLLEVSEAKTMIERYDETPLTGVLNVKDALKRSTIGSTLHIEELLRIVSLIEAASRSNIFIKKVRQLLIPSEILNHYYDEILTHPALKKAIELCIDDKGQIYDDASSELATIRKKMHVSEKRVEEKMASLLKSEQSKLTDSIITIRNNRLVLPVKAEYKNSFKGIIHDQSSSKETVFIEPMSCVEINNLLQTLLVEEKQAIEKILAALSYEVSLCAFELEHNLMVFTSLDIIFAKAKYSISEQLEAPLITKNEIDLINARHPLIPREVVVPNTISFYQYHTIVITGPNTGGKTVALKTLGLLSIMVQSGLHIPVSTGSKTIVFNNIFADIGDEQSIEQSLSTFSSHITKIITILRIATRNSLILLDELGSGTDPKEGASLAISILDYIRNKNVFSMVTTHYPELKVYAYDLEDTVNASVEFDIESLKPTYRLQIGVPGTSNALDIASRLGLMDEIVNHARTVSMQFDNDTIILMKKLEKQSVALQKEIDETIARKEALAVERAELDKLIVSSKQKYNQRLKEIDIEKDKVLAKTQEEAYVLIRELDELKKSADFKEHELARIKHEVKNLGAMSEQFIKLNQKRIMIGDVVNVVPYQKSGIVMKKRGPNEYVVQMGVLTGNFSEKDLEFIEKKQESKSISSGRITLESSAKVELDLRGKRFDEAMELLDKYVDDCLMNHLEFAYIIHGYGTGALRKGVLDYLKKNKTVKSFRPGGASEGGSGVTVMYLR